MELHFRCVVVKFVTTQQLKCCVVSNFSQHNKLILLCCEKFLQHNTLKQLCCDLVWGGCHEIPHRAEIHAWVLTE